ncbi:MAG: Ty1/Copia family ribonuclease HI [Chloroflexi bacterium]|nr:MAG: Ty1/Copia family ribonuclease HI [Chloroflexota bacterium]
MKELGELKWFLGMHIFRDRSKKSLWLSQSSYIEKVANEFIPDLDPSRCPYTPIAEEELLPLPAEDEVKDPDRTLYQRKIGSILYAAISTRPDIAFAAARLSRFNQRPSKIHQAAADRLILYLYRTRHLCIQYGRQSTATSLVCASDASFADNTMDRKSSQGYIMKLFGGPVAWRANKQDTVTTSSTEAEFLALSQTAKETIYLSRLLKALSLELDEPLTIECDNRQTIRLLVEESVKLQTKLRHVDIHSHWLRQEVQRGTIAITWQETKKMVADGLTKALGKALFQRFTEMVGLEDQKRRLGLIRREDELREHLKELRIEEFKEEARFAYTRDLGYGP